MSSMALVLQYTQEWFREKYNWNWNQCGVEFESIPSFSAGNFFVSIDDAGMNAGREDTDSETDVLSIIIGVWRREEYYMKDQLGALKLPTDRYIAGALTLSALEDMVRFNEASRGGIYGLSRNYEFLSGLNTRFSLPSEDLGASFTEPFKYQGRGSMETRVLDHSDIKEQVWYGYRLRFKGLKREQIIHRTDADYAVG